MNTTIYRGYDENSHKPVIIKAIATEYPTLEEISRLRQEYLIGQSLCLEGVVKVYRLERNNHHLALILEDFGGQSLKEMLQSQAIPLKDFLQIALSLVDTLAQLHQIPILHKDINPSNIIVNWESGQVKLTDFAIASRLSQEIPTISHPNLLEGTLTYIAPEQTGRMNRAVDYRADFYSLGVTFYEILTGKVPFAITDPMELIHAHLAKSPIPPKILKEGQLCPQPIADIVMKLLAKNAEDRYQSAAGLKLDLEKCLTQLEQTGSITNFTVAQQDRRSQFLIPPKLYGREAEVTTLMDVFSRVSRGAAEFVLVSGYSGIGKTAIVNEVHKPIVEARGYFIAGKFDQFQRDIPYAALIQALRSLIQQLLMETALRLSTWKASILEALGDNAQLLIGVIPELELIIGQQHEVYPLGALEAEKRFERLLKAFIRVFTQPEHPLVIFLDDLQWGDLASLKFLQTLMTERDHGYLLTIGAYRDNEVNSTHPLIQTIEKLEKTDSVIHNLIIQPLAKADVIQLLKDTLHNSEENLSVQGLGELIFQKTQGNPFFINQLLKTLYEQKSITYDFNQEQWRWDLETIQAIGIQDNNVVELIANNISRLSASTQQVLKLAACLGNQFSLDVLGTVNEESLIKTANDLWEAIQAGLILPLNEHYKTALVLEQQELTALSDLEVNYKFLHDRVQQAAYCLIPEFERKVTHLKIGNLLLKNTAPEKQAATIFALVNQLNLGIDLLTSQKSKNKLANLNLKAGKKAKLSAAYAAQRKYINLGLFLLEANSWFEDYELTISLYSEAIEAEYLNGNFAQSQQLAEVALSQAKTLLEKVKIYEAQIQAYIAQNQMQIAIETGLQTLVMLGINLSQESPPNLEIEALANLPQMSDHNKLAAIRILVAIISPAYITNPSLLLPITWTAINLFIQAGNTDKSSYIYTIYGVITLAFMGDINQGYQFGQLGMTLLNQFESRSVKAKVIELFNGFIRPWKEPIRNTIEPCLEAVQIGLDYGDLEYASYAAINYCTYQFFAGESLALVEQQHLKYLSLMEKSKQEYALVILKIFNQLVLNLNKIENQKSALNQEILSLLQQSNNQTWFFYFHVSQLILAYFLKDFALAFQQAQEAEKYYQSAAGLITVAEYNFYYSLTILAQYDQTEERDRDPLLKQLQMNQETLKIWVTHAPTNFQHKYDLIEAETARILGNNWEAMELYDRSIEGAKTHQYLQEEALACELAAEFYLSWGKEKIARTYLKDAYYQYDAWGAVAKTKQLAERHPQLLAPIIAQETSAIALNSPAQATITVTMADLDFTSILKASQSISQELILDRLLDTLMKILLENTGAQTGFLILAKDDQLSIEIAGSIARQGITIKQSIPLQISQQVAISIIEYVARTQEIVVLDDTVKEALFANDPYIQKTQPKSILCAPILKQKELLGVAYLENNLAKGMFRRDRQEIVKLLCTQAAISLENAQLYQALQQSQARERAEQQIRKALAKEKELTELKAQFISMASHEFRTPLTTILGSTELLKYYSHNWSDEKKQSHFNRIEANVKHMTYLLESVLLIGKAEAGKLECVPTPLDLEDFCRTFVEEIRLGTNAQQTLIFSHQGQSRVVKLDERLLRHILSNLLGNAIKYSPRDSTVDFKLQFEPSQVIFQIQDRGIGIPPADLERLFESFHRANNVGNIPGTGLGLAIVKRSVDLQGGKITVNSEVGIGTTFTVTIPINSP